MNWFDNNDTVSYGCIRVALEPQPSERKNATLIKRVRQIGLCLTDDLLNLLLLFVSPNIEQFTDRNISA